MANTSELDPPLGSLPPEPRPSVGAAPSPPPVQLGQRLGKYRLDAKLGQGGMGVVYRAHDEQLQRDVAVKILPRAAGVTDAHVRFLREARAVAKLNHPQIVTIHDVGEHQGLAYIVLEYLPAGSVQGQLERQGCYDWPTATRIIADAARGLAAAHAAGLVHRDIKPANLLCAPPGGVKVADFGLVRTQTGAALTVGGSVVGTPEFMSPEQAQGEALDGRTDLYALGATYFALLTGAPPFLADAPLAVLFMHCSQPAPDVRQLQPSVPASVAQVVARLLAKLPADRYPDAPSLVRDLERILNDATATAEVPISPITEVESGLLPTTADLPSVPARFKWRRVVVALLLLLLGLAVLDAFIVPWVLRAPAPAPAPPTEATPPQLGPLREVLLPGGQVGALSFARRQPWLVVVDGKGPNGLQIFDWTTGQRVRQWPDVKSRVAVLDAAEEWVIVTNTHAGTVEWLHTRTDERRQQKLVPPDGAELRIACYVQPSGRWYGGLAPWGRKQFLVQWEQPAGPVRHLPGPTGQVWSMALTHDQRWLAIGAQDRHVYLWDTQANQLHQKLTAGPGSISPSVGFVGDTTDLWTTEANGLQRWKQVLGKWEPAERLHIEHEPYRLHCAGRFLAYTQSDGTAAVYNSSNGQLLRRFRGTGQTAWAVAFAPDGTMLAIGDDSGRVRLERLP
jgi:WD40 repeat protein